MRFAKRSSQIRNLLDRRFAEANIRPLRGNPPGGWVRSVRTALGMSASSLAQRLDISQPALTQLEKSEVQSTITIGKLQQIANALDCDFYYAIVPRTSLNEMVEQQALRVATRQIDLNNPDEISEHAKSLIETNRIWNEA